MKALRKLVYLAAFGAGLTLTMAGHAQSTAAVAPAAKAASAEMTEAEVRKVDKENRKITLKHGAIKNLDMPPMTMVFQVRDATVLEKIKAGDRVRFAAINDGGKLTVTQIQPGK